jgi:CHAD domain-containing protein
MAEALQRTEAGTRGVRRVLLKQVDKALKALQEPGPSLPDEAIHSARKRLKKARAYLRSLREEMGNRRYRRENTALRDAARPLIEVRDAKVLVDALDELTEHFPGEVDGQALVQVRQALLDGQQEIRRRILEDQDGLAAVTKSLQAARERLRDSSIGRHGWSVLGAGLKRTYRAARDAFLAAREAATVETLHEWRKQVKYLWHQFQVLQPIAPAVLDELIDQADHLADHLGDDHDLAVLHQKVQEEPARSADAAGIAALLGLIERRRTELQREALALGHQLHAEKPKQFVARLGGYWRLWRSPEAARV